MINKNKEQSVVCDVCGKTDAVTAFTKDYKPAHQMIVVSVWNSSTFNRDYLDMCSKECLVTWAADVKFARAGRLLKALSNKQWVKAKDLADAENVSIKTVYRTLQCMREKGWCSLQTGSFGIKLT